VNQLSLFTSKIEKPSLFTPVDTFVSYFAECIAEGHADATLIPDQPSGDPEDAIAATRAALEELGWVWNTKEKQLERGGWYVWFRSQGRLSSPIAQWNKLGEM